MSTQRVLIYGATGYTGKLVAAEAARRGLDVVLAARDPARLKAVAEPLELESRSFSLDDPARLRAALEDIAAVLHVAGPFSQTSRPMVDACLETGTHYLDVTGEIDVFEAIARRDEEARRANVLLLPGVGFDVVPSDCLAVHTAARIEEPGMLRLAIAGMALGQGGVSRGTLKTAIESIGDGLVIRRDGILRRRPPGSLEHHFDLGAGPARGVAMPWGDVSTAFYSTGIPNIEVYFILSGRIPRLLRTSRFIAPLLRQPVVQRFLKARIDALPEGPDAEARAGTRALLLAEVEGPGGERARSMLETPSGYALTPLTAVEAARRAAGGVDGAADAAGTVESSDTGTRADPSTRAGAGDREVPTGFQTPAMAFGADFVMEAADCVRTDLD